MRGDERNARVKETTDAQDVHLGSCNVGLPVGFLRRRPTGTHDDGHVGLQSMERKRVVGVTRWLLTGFASAIAAMVLAQSVEAPPHALVAGTPASASEVSENFEVLETGVLSVRELIIEVRRTQVRLRDRIAALEPFVLDPQPPPTTTSARETITSSEHFLPRPEDTEPVVFDAGTVVDAEAVNERFGRIEADLSNTFLFVQTLYEDLLKMLGRLSALEELQLPDGAEEGTPEALVPVDADVEHTFVAGTTMRSSDMNANFEKLSTAIARTMANARALEAAHGDVVRRLEALEASVSFRCDDVRPDRLTRVFAIDVVPASPASLSSNDEVVASFDYVTNALDLGYDGFRVWFQPHFDGEYAPGGSYQPSGVETAPSGTLSRSFAGDGLDPGESTQVNEGHVFMQGVQLDENGVQVGAVPILECIVPVDITFTAPQD